MKSFRSLIPTAVILMAFASLAACSKKTVTATTPMIVRGIHVFQTESRKMPETADAVGTVRAMESATLSSQVMGIVTSIAVREGDHVRAGQTLISINAAQLASQAEQAHASFITAGQQIASAESDAALAASTLKRYEALKEQKSVSPQEFDEVQARSRSASARLAMVRSQEGEAKAAESASRTMQGYTRIRAPFDGVVTERKIDPGAMATPGSMLLTIEKAGPHRLEVSVDESLLLLVRAGASIPVLIDVLGNTPVEGKIAQIVPAADPGSRSFLVKIELPAASGLRSGMYGHALLARGFKDILVIPRSSVVAHGSMQSVYVIGQSQIAQARYISVGNVHGNEVEVLSGLSAGETVVDFPGDRELTGKRIEAQQ